MTKNDEVTWGEFLRNQIIVVIVWIALTLLFNVWLIGYSGAYDFNPCQYSSIAESYADTLYLAYP